MTYQDLTGQRFGRLTVVLRAENSKSGLTRWHCLCDCGSKRIVFAGALKIGNTKSCGCLKAVRAKECNTKHGLSSTPTYNTWSHMKRRCLNPNNFAYSRYGGRGITVCDRWLESFENFLVDMGEAPPGMSLDRIDNDGNYKPGNCRWATPLEQGSNKCNNHLIEFEGKTQSLSQWANEYGIQVGTLWYRLKEGWLIEEALTKPLMTPQESGSLIWATPTEQNGNKRSNRLFKFDGRVQKLSQWAREFCIDAGTLRNRLEKGWPIEEALTKSPMTPQEAGKFSSHHRRH